MSAKKPNPISVHPKKAPTIPARLKWIAKGVLNSLPVGKQVTETALYSIVLCEDAFLKGLAVRLRKRLDDREEEGGEDVAKVEDGDIEHVMKEMGLGHVYERASASLEECEPPPETKRRKVGKKKKPTKAQVKEEERLFEEAMERMKAKAKTGSNSSRC